MKDEPTGRRGPSFKQNNTNSHINLCFINKLSSYIFSADERLIEYRDALCIVTSDGNVTWLPQAVFKSQCNVDVGSFPFDKQTCKLKFGSWTYNGNQLDLLFKGGKENFTLADYTESNVWEVLSVPAARNIFKYQCCPEPYIDLTFTLVIRRRATFYANILILPCVLLTSLTLVLFWIPPESPAKMMLGLYKLEEDKSYLSFFFFKLKYIH